MMKVSRRGELGPITKSGANQMFGVGKRQMMKIGVDGVDVGVDYYYHIIANHRVTGAESRTKQLDG